MGKMLGDNGINNALIDERRTNKTDNSMRILLVEDDVMIGEVMQASLKDAGYAVDWVQDGQIALSALAVQNYDLLLLDLGLPKKDGLLVLAEIRRQDQQLPIVIATARDDLNSRLQGLDGGADDYVVKPFQMEELLARLRAVVRRKHHHGQLQLSNGLLTLDPSSYQVWLCGNSEAISLTHKEFSLLQTLMQHQGRIYSRAELEDKIYAWGEEVESNAIDYLIHSLRKKLGKESIRNIRGAGWSVNKGGAT
ncbi:two-component system OmpR family response regulator [Testudinibacter aquarius]|uniref:Two-component system OmpR family response regulator n=2 Tax=Testudinibacter aquarius TaxID=1524974 RepID=A0A4R3Y084_9PAST|nr:two-component system OmpR family response regulator [Testudinibacter aquarius]